MRTVPTLNIRDFSGAHDSFVTALGEAYRELGFCSIAGHGIDPDLIGNAYATFAEVFALPDAVKRRYHVAGGGGARGYTPFRIETAKGARNPDLKEFWHIGRELSPGSPWRTWLPPNVWPDEVPAFRQHGLALYRALDALGRRVLAAIALHLGLPAHWFDERVDHGNSILRPLHYPPLEPTPTPGLRADAHEDINLITLLIGASDAGLEILGPDGSWLPLTAPPGAIVVNIGDMLQRLTNHVLRSTTHRVVNPVGEAATRARYSVPFFLHPNPDVRLEVLPQCVSRDNPCRYPQPITANDYLQERLREIRLL